MDLLFEFDKRSLGFRHPEQLSAGTNPDNGRERRALLAVLNRGCIIWSNLDSQTMDFECASEIFRCSLSVLRPMARRFG